MSEESGAPTQEPRRSRIRQADIPMYSLERARRVPQALADNYASHATRPMDVASALGMQPSSGGFRGFLGAAIGYGLTEGGPNASEVSLTPLGSRIVTPTEVDDDKVALREAALKPTVANQFYTKYDGSPLPPKNIAQNVLSTFGVPGDRTSDVYDLLIENAEFVGFMKTIKDKQYVDVEGPVQQPPPESSTESEHLDDLDQELDERPPDFTGPNGTSPAATSTASPPASDPEPTKKNAIFVGHGGNKKPMEQLVKILTEYGIPHKVAVEEPNRARPIPHKVAETMRECGAAILVFTADNLYFDTDHNRIWRPSDNVYHELGAASVLYGERIVIFKEKGIELPSNFSSVGYIEFETDQLSDKGIELFRELVSMKIVSISVG